MFKRENASRNIKLLLISFATIIAISTLVYTQNLVNRLQDKERTLAELYASSTKYIIESTEILNDYTFIMENVIKKIDFPLIYTSGHDDFVDLENPDLVIRNLKIDSTLTLKQKEEYIRDILNDLDDANDPIEITHEGMVLGKIHYGDSELVKNLKFYPYFQILFAIFFIAIAYFSFNYIKRSEEGRIWVGMSKETAHQLGTPVSSLMGWYEYLKLNYNNPDKVIDIAEEINNDLDRLNKIANRFSKIGSTPELTYTNISDIINGVVSYFQRRIPQTGKDVELIVNNSDNLEAYINPPLFEWVCENLIKNALDAIDVSKGKIKFKILNKNGYLIIDVSDNGKGIEAKRKDDIFKPGYSTKKRGWGLGLSLSRRIIQDYHKGKIFVKSSIPGKGTVIEIVLNRKKI